MTQKIDEFVSTLQQFKPMPKVFNPWSQHDRENDASELGPAIRSGNLRRYLKERHGRAKLLLIAEAGGHQGLKHSGIAMTSERILLGLKAHEGIVASHVIEGPCERTSSQARGRWSGMTEPTATMVWRQILQSGVNPRDLVLWNAFPFHPQGDKVCSNRPPSDAELQAGKPILRAMLDLFPTSKVITVGDVSRDLLDSMDVACLGTVRHPSNGGKAKFAEGFARLTGDFKAL